jgi:fluoroquinolone transport system permease protein
MKTLYHLMGLDLRLLFRYKIVLISALVTLLYVLVFRFATGLGDIHRLLVLVIFNDPALLGFLFVGVMVLFEKNENTMQALSVLPFHLRYYVLSKTIVLSVLSLLCCYSMWFAASGRQADHFLFVSAVLLSTAMFSFLGFVAVAGQKRFNDFLLRAIGIIVLLCLPFLGFFEVLNKWWFCWMPTMPAIELFDMALHPGKYSSPFIVLMYVLLSAWTFLLYMTAVKKITENFKS